MSRPESPWAVIDRPYSFAYESGWSSYVSALTQDGVSATEKGVRPVRPLFPCYNDVVNAATEQSLNDMLREILTSRVYEVAKES